MTSFPGEGLRPLTGATHNPLLDTAEAGGTPSERDPVAKDVFPGTVPVAAAVSSSEESTAGRESRALKATGLLGAGSLVAMIFGIVRTKTFALLIGPSGVGLIGIYAGIIGTVESVVGLGLSHSGIRAIADAGGRSDTPAVLRLASFLSRACLVLGVLGSLAIFAFRRQLSVASFGSTQHAGAIGLLAIGLVFSVNAGPAMAYMTGLRRTRSIVAANVGAAILSTVFSVVLVWAMGERGIVPAVLVTPICLFGVARVTARRQGMRVQGWGIEPGDGRTFADLSRLGVAIVCTGFLSAGTLLAARLVVASSSGVKGAGLFHAAWGLSTMYFGFVTGAIGTDFYPRLSEVCRHPPAAREAIRSQMDQTLLLVAPMALGLFLVGPTILDLLYSSKFREAWPVVQWMLLGHLVKAAYLPMAFLFLARGAAIISVLLEVFWSALFLGGMAALSPRMGLHAAGIAFVLASAAYLVVVTVSVTRVVGQPWTWSVAARAGAAVGTMALAMTLPGGWRYVSLAAGWLVTFLLGWDLFRRLGPMFWTGVRSRMPWLRGRKGDESGKALGGSAVSQPPAGKTG